MKIREIACLSEKDFPRKRFLPLLKKEGILFVHFSEKIDLTRLISSFGSLVPHDSFGTYCWDVKSLGGKRKSLARSLTVDPFPLHTDASFRDPPPNYVALYVLEEDRFGGGKNFFLPFSSIEKEFSPSLKKILHSRFHFFVPEEFFQGEKIHEHSILLSSGGIRYREECIDTSVCSLAEKNALLFLKKKISLKNPSVFHLQVSKNTVIFFDNTKYLHGRTKVKDPQRHLQRVWFNEKSSF